MSKIIMPPILEGITEFLQTPKGQNCPSNMTEPPIQLFQRLPLENSL